MLLFAVVETVTSQPQQTGPATSPVAQGAMQTGNYGYPADIEQDKPPCDWSEIAKASGYMSVAGSAIGAKFVGGKEATIVGGVVGGVAGAAGAYYDCV